VIKHLNLLETSYFGLKYLDSASPSHQNDPGQKVEQIWLDVNKSAIKQLKDIHPMTVYFGVKYYATDPCKLAEEITRYQFFLQCKQDILHSRLPVSFDLAIELFALAVQSELGDYDPQRHQDGYVSEFHFLPNQSIELEKRVALFHRNLTGQVPATAELNFLERVKWLDLYGCELHPIQYDDTREEYALGLNPSGVLVLRNKRKVAHYLWPRIVKTKCQGRCFLMDVVDSSTGGAGTKGTRNRFGFRLADRAASRRLRWAVEEHKSFHHLIHDSATLNQLAHRQLQLHQQQMNFSQRFRHSIRSAINVGPMSASSALQAQLAQQHRLRSSVKSLNSNALGQQHQYPLDLRQPPTVVRMPSRRYNNRSLTRSSHTLGQMNSAGNGNGLPSSAQTMVESQRQQAIMMMNQFNQMNNVMSKSQTLKPVTSKLDVKEAKKNPYYQMMMMTAAANSNQRPEVAILPPGRHIVQPSIYRASSVVNGINQMGNLKQEQGSAMMQFFNTRPQLPTHQAGHESPRSTKSAIAPSSALKMATKRLARQQQVLYANNTDAQPLMPYEQHQQMYSLNANGEYYALGGQYNFSNSANPSPRSVRSARLASRHKSKSTNENLHLIHNPKFAQPAMIDEALIQNNKMLLSTTQLMQHQNMPPPPPGYNSGGSNSRPQVSIQRQLNSDNESELSKMSKRSGLNKKRATFALDNDQANLLLNTQGLMEGGRGKQRVAIGAKIAQPVGRELSDGEDNYCCSRSDCSSIDDGERNQLNSSQQFRSARFNNQLTNQQRRKRPVNLDNQHQQVSSRPDKTQFPIDNQEEWNAIRRRHSEFSNGKGFLMNNLNFNQTPQELEQNACSPIGLNEQESGNARRYEQEDVNNNGNGNASNLVKNITNKQATPILLSMNYDQTNANNKAVQLLNMQRQQLNSQSSNDGGVKSPLSVVDSAPSSVASSPLATGNQQQSAQKANKTADSTASSSTTSGYYAGSNSTGSASVDSDSQADGHQESSQASRKQGAGGKGGPSRNHTKSNNLPQFRDWKEEGSRAKIAIGSYASAANSNRSFSNNQPQFKSPISADLRQKRSQQQPGNHRQFYLDDSNYTDEDNKLGQSLQPTQVNSAQHWSPLDQIQQNGPSSLKYVSFDV